MLIAELDRAARGKPRLQVATDGCWERARAFPLPLTGDDVDRALDAVEVVEVGVEVLWPGPPIVFVGARVGRLHRLPLYEIATRSDRAPSQALEVLAGASLGPPVRAELGAINAWRSVAPLPLKIDADAAAIDAALARRRDLASCNRPVALEIVHHELREAWWGIEVSSRVADTHQVRAEAVVRVLRSITANELRPCAGA